MAKGFSVVISMALRRNTTPQTEPDSPAPSHGHKYLRADERETFPRRTIITDPITMLIIRMLIMTRGTMKKTNKTKHEDKHTHKNNHSHYVNVTLRAKSAHLHCDVLMRTLLHC